MKGFSGLGEEELKAVFDLVLHFGDEVGLALGSRTRSDGGDLSHVETRDLPVKEQNCQSQPKQML